MMGKARLAEVGRHLLDLLYPPRCYACEQHVDGGGLCAPCWQRLPMPQAPMCVICGMPFRTPRDRDHLCGDCLRHRPHFQRARACALYDAHDDGSPLRRCLHDYKYQRRTHMVRPLAEILSRRSPLPAADYDLIVPVPLHLERLRWRGFNQALLLAKRYAAQGPPIDAWCLERVVATQPQVELSGTERRGNVANAFVASAPDRVRGRRILLIDDVYTTGATVDECAKVLMRARARSVDVLVLARAIVQ